GVGPLGRCSRHPDCQRGRSMVRRSIPPRALASLGGYLLCCPKTGPRIASRVFCPTPDNSAGANSGLDPELSQAPVAVFVFLAAATWASGITADTWHRFTGSSGGTCCCPLSSS